MHRDLKVQRNELKYYLSYSGYVMLSDILKKFLLQDKHNKEKLGGYFIRSLYFDDIDDKAFEDKMAGIEERSKYRLRIYDVSDKWVKFEIKNKFNDNITKETAIISRDDAKEIQNGNFEVMLKYNNPILNKAYIEFKKYSYKPVSLIDYLREAFVYDVNNVRIVFDRFLKSSTLHLDIFKTDPALVPQLKKEIIIMEIKYDHFIPSWIKELIQIPSFDRSAISKYCIGRLDRFETLF
jgi:hypothetical protein